MHANLRHFEQRLPHRLQRRFHGSARRHVLANLLVRLRQCAAVELAVGCHRQLIEQQYVAWLHVLWQRVAQVLLEWLKVGMTDDVSHQLPGLADIQGNHHGFAHLWMLQQAGFDFPQFDAQAADLHLMIDAADVFDHAVLAVACQIAGAIQAFALLTERAGDEALGGQVRTVVVTPGKADAAQVQLAHTPLHLRLQAVVEDVGHQVGNRITDRHAEPAVIDTGPVGYVDRRFGRAVQVVQADVRQDAEQAVLQVCRQGFAAAHDLPQAGATLEAFALDKRLQHRRHEMQGADPVLLDQADQLRRIAMGPRFGHGQPCAGHQRPEELPDRHVETERGFLQDGVAPVQRIGALHPRQAVVQGLMVVGRALGFAGGAGGVDHVGQRLQLDHTGQVFVAQVVQQTGHVIETNRRGGGRNRQLLKQMTLGQQQVYAAVVEHVLQAFARVVRVQRHVGATGLHDRQQADHQFQ
ncbi:hypothetical protein D3C75_411490 [compost metagenome]